MAIDISDLRQKTLDPDVEADIDAFARNLASYLGGDLDEDVFRVTRRTNGIYGQRQGEPNQMARVKIPHGRLSPGQLEEIDRIWQAYPHLRDDDFVAEHIDRWLS